MTVVDQLDQTLFDKFLTPKVTIATGKLRGGILDPGMDWYDTPQPTGESAYMPTWRHCGARVSCMLPHSLRIMAEY
jgi:hypothetical protein